MSKREIVMTEGSMLGNMLRFSIPLILTNVLQITFSAADSAVVGQFAGSDALASVGATTTLIHLLINLFIGLSTGTSIVVSFALGANDEEGARRHSHNAVATALISGVFIGIVGIFVARPALVMMDTPENVLEGAIIYFRIYFAGAPVLLLYNFGAAILRANGDTKRPFIYLTLGGILNVILNLVFVIGFNMEVAGVALATVVANALSAVLVLRELTKINSACRVSIKKIRIYKDKLLAVLKFGLPAGIQSCMFSLPNLMIQASINSFGEAALAGNTAARNIDAYYDVCNNAFSECALTFVSRNYGAKKYKRIKTATCISLAGAMMVSLVLGVGSYIIREPLLSIFISNNPEAMEYGMTRMFYLALPNFIAAAMGVLTAAIRGVGKPIFPMITTVLGVCGVRILWLIFVLPMYNTIECVYFTYPFTWALTCIALGVYLCISYRCLMKRTA